jgi:ATP-dependent DNA helicase DinG
MSELSARTRAALEAGGALAEAIPAFVPRAAQQRLADAIVDAFDARSVLLAEAGTGTGKTYAYLVPALLSGMKTIVSTGTKALQDQLYHRDLPRVRDALGVGLKTALLKGRANYLCRFRLEQAKGEPKFANREQVAQFQRIVAWSGRTRLGDLSEMDLPEDSPLLPMVTSTADNCLGSECPFWSECFVVQARARAQAADLVVVNHHLLLADLALKQEGFGEILPGAQAFVVDEAHQLPELAAQFFGEGLGARPLVELARDAIAECKQVTGALASVQPVAAQLEHATRALRAAMEALPARGTRQRALQSPEVEEGLHALAEVLLRFGEVVAALRDASPGFDSCLARAQEFGRRLERWIGRPRTVVQDEEFETQVSDDVDEQEGRDVVPDPTADALPNRDHAPRKSRLDASAEDGGLTRGGPGSDGAFGGSTSVHWYELSPRGFRLQRTPLDVSGPLRTHRERSHAAWIFTSATLSVAGGFEHVAERLGLIDPETLLQPSPFDWNAQALCYLPPRLPEPMARDYTTALVDALVPVLEASGGRAFVLFASHRALREAAGLLRDGPWPLFVQGEAPRHVLLQRFRESGNGVLLGAASFREGVDVVGEALSVVVIDKLPFAAPDDPVFEARLDAVRRRGGNPFRDEQLPQAVIALKQGVGRLIRSESDRGVLVLCDPRLTQKTYGKVFLDSLPPLPVTRHIDDVRAFFGAESAPLSTGMR